MPRTTEYHTADGADQQANPEIQKRLAKKDIRHIPAIARLSASAIPPAIASSKAFREWMTVSNPTSMASTATTGSRIASPAGGPQEPMRGRH